MDPKLVFISIKSISWLFNYSTSKCTLCKNEERLFRLLTHYPKCKGTIGYEALELQHDEGIYPDIDEIYFHRHPKSNKNFFGWVLVTSSINDHLEHSVYEGFIYATSSILNEHNQIFSILMHGCVIKFLRMEISKNHKLHVKSYPSIGLDLTEPQQLHEAFNCIQEIFNDCDTTFATIIAQEYNSI